jgi:hypothetical protein
LIGDRITLSDGMETSEQPTGLGNDGLRRDAEVRI